MPFSESHARSLLRKLAQPQQALENRKCWDTMFLRLFLDHCDDVLFDDPGAGIKLAEIAPKLALLVPKKSPEEWKFVSAADKQLHRELVVRSFAVVGGAYRAAARFSDANNAYRNAVKYARSGPIRPIVRANLEKRLAKLRSAQGRFDEALELLRRASQVYRKEDDQSGYADLLNTNGYVLAEQRRFSEAIPYFGQALVLAKGTRRTSKLADKTVFCATLNLANAVIDGCLPNDLIQVLPLVIKAKRYHGRARNTMNQQRLAWVEARILARLGSDRQAEKRLLRAQEIFRKLGAPLEAALVALELSILYLQWGGMAKPGRIGAQDIRRIPGSLEPYRSYCCVAPLGQRSQDPETHQEQHSRNPSNDRKDHPANWPLKPRRQELRRLRLLSPNLLLQSSCIYRGARGYRSTIPGIRMYDPGGTDVRLSRVQMYDHPQELHRLFHKHFRRHFHKP